MHDVLFKNQAMLVDSFYAETASRLGLASGRFDSCLAGAGQRTVDADANTASKFKIMSTPTFFIGIVSDSGDVHVTSVLQGAQGIDAFRKPIDSALQGRLATR